MTAFPPNKFELMRRNRDVLFFTLNGFGWITWCAAQVVGYKLNDKPEPGFLIVIAVGAVTGFILTTILRYMCRMLWRQQPLVMAIGALVAAYVIALPMRAAINFSFLCFVEPVPMLDHWYDIFSGVLWNTYLFAGWMGMYFGFHFYEANQKERETALRATALAQSAQLKMLRYQLNPHFLFNTLNAISTLVLDRRNEVANTVVTRLADFLRYTLDQDPMKTVTLSKEVSALNLYLEIEKMRFGSRLSVDIDIADAGAAQVPSLLLQPLIENAIKYAISPNEQGGDITIRGRIDSSNVVLSIQDNGPGMIDTARVDSGRGVGLRNTRERLLAMYGDRAQLEFLNVHPGLRITLTFPARLNEQRS